MNHVTARGPKHVESPERDLPGALHEVSNALTVILGWIESAEGTTNNPSTTRALAIASAQARHARTIVRRAIGAETEPSAPTPAAEVVATAVVSLEPEARRAAVSVKTSIGEGVSALLVHDTSALLQILTNLLLNAIAASPRGKSVDVSARLSADGSLVVTVTDEGEGIAPERRATLFSAGVTTRAFGAGVGLRHAKALADSAGGSLKLCESPSGACFELCWTEVPTTQPTQATRPRKGTPLAGSRILVIEDDASVVELLDMALGARGVNVVSVRQRSELPGALQTGVFDAALFDLSPIEDDVAGAVRAIRETSPDARLIVISGSAKGMPELPLGCEASWVRKPFEIAEIVRALEDA